MCAINPLYHLSNITKFRCSFSQLAYQVSDAIRILSVSRNNLERCPYPRGDPDVQPADMQESSKSYVLSPVHGVRWLTRSHICIPTTGARLFQLQLESGTDQHCNQVGTSSHHHKLHLGYCAVICLPWIHLEPWAWYIHQDQMHPSWPPPVVIAWSEWQEEAELGMQGTTLLVF